MSSNLDLWEQKLKEQVVILKQCQADKGYKSCLACEQINDCQTRDTYVKAVYDSMSKGKGGGFEF